jgi:hypothetical protein
MLSMRDIGYSLETAVADLIDNSIAADANLIDIIFDVTGSWPVFVIADNGSGMSQQQLVAAMRHGARAPSVERATKDLGRFGLGLKTASFSQCRHLTVVSKQNDQRAGAEWDLAVVERTDDWIINILDDGEIEGQPYFDTLGSDGTLVIWRVLDRLLEDEKGHKRDEIVNEKLNTLERHLALVFHRFLSGDVKGRKKLSIRVNGHNIEPFDPFCTKNGATQVLPRDTVRINGTAVTLQGYILPHHSRLTKSEYEYYQDRSDFVSNQGAYVYRNARLMAWGDWFRLITKGEATKLARVQIDFPSSLDEAWTIDIKKSRARPPQVVKEQLRQVIQDITTRSVNVHRGRGQKLFSEVQSPVWERYADHNSIRYAVNMQHPLIQSLLASVNDEDGRILGILLESVSAALPIEMIYSDFSTNANQVSQVAGDVPTIERLEALRVALYGQEPVDRESFLRVVESTHLFDANMEIVKRFTF